MPDFELENTHKGAVCGIDEVGRGPLAGPVVAACVHIPYKTRTLPFITELKDSKKISKPKLEILYEHITQNCTFSIAEISVEEIDKINILQASLKAMTTACRNMEMLPSFALVDGNQTPDLPCPAKAIIKGDSKSYSIAAASIIAKVTRDRMMKKLHENFPYYGWDTNAGYGSKAHLDGINQHGITEHHRKSYAPIKNFIAHGSTLKITESAA